MNVKEAVKIAFKYMDELFDTETLEQLALEEVELSEEDGYWHVTLGFIRRLPSGAMDALQGGRWKREYKVFRIDPDNGEVKSMKIREEKNAF